MTTQEKHFTPGQRVHVRTLPGGVTMDEDATYVMANPAGYEFVHVVNLDRGSRLQFREFEVTPIAEPTKLIENADWADAINALGEEMPGHQNRRYTITFEENEA